MDPVSTHQVSGVCPFAANAGVDDHLDESLRRFGTVLTDAHDSELAPGVKANEPIRDEIAKVTGTFMYDRAVSGMTQRCSRPFHSIIID